MTCGTGLQQEEVERIIIGFAAQAQKQIPVNLQRQRKRVIVIAGPTACGKTDFSIQLAEQINGEIISADSMQVYRQMNIGTAKASLEQIKRVPHHLIDIRDVSDPFNVVDFYYEARRCTQEILDREAVPIVTGGSGFYLHSLIYGPPNGPPSVPELRKSLEDEMEKIGPELMYERLKEVDPQYAATITRNDKQKIIRAFEIITLSGKKVSRHSWKSRKKMQNFDFRCWFLYRPRNILYRRIDERCDWMLNAGLVDEVKRLKEEGLFQNHSACQAVGYRQVLEFLNTPQTLNDYERMVVQFKQASRLYAKRQFTWFRKEPLFRWIDMDLHEPEAAIQLIRQDYESAPYG